MNNDYKNLTPHNHMPNDHMTLFNKYENDLKEALKEDEGRYWHSVSVALTAVSLGDIYGANLDDCMVAGLLHDYCKCIPVDKMLEMCKEYGLELSEEDKNADGCIHGFLAAKVCKKKFDVNDAVYNAIYYHTCGRPNMTILEKVIYIADFIEPLRRFRDKINDIRTLAFKDIDAAVVLSSEQNLKFLNNHNKFIHSNTIKTLEYYKSLNK